MTDKELRKKLNEELGKMTPPADEKILAQPIVVHAPRAAEPVAAGSGARSGSAHRPLRFAGKTRGRIVAAVAAAAVALCVLLGVFFLPVALPQPSYGTLVVQINPTAVFAVDGDNNVVRVSALNADADVLLSDEDFLGSLTGVPAGQSVVAFAVRARDAGFLQDGGKVSVSAATESEKQSQSLLNSVEQGLNDVFSSTGFAFSFEGVIAGMEHICDLIGVQMQSLGELVETIRSMPVYTFAREIAGLNAQELAALYEERVVHGLYKDMVSALLEECYGRVQALDAMDALNEEIAADVQNPAPVGRDYWSVRMFYDDADMAPAFAEKMARMDALVASYAECFGRKMDSYASFLSEKILYSGISSVSEEIAAWLSDFTDHLFDLQLDNIFDLLGNVFVDFTDQLSALYDRGMPETTEEYVEQTREACRLWELYLAGDVQA